MSVRLPVTVTVTFDYPDEWALIAWARTVEKRDELVKQAYRNGISKNRIYTLTGIARTTIARILKDEPDATSS